MPVVTIAHESGSASYTSRFHFRSGPTWAFDIGAVEVGIVAVLRPVRRVGVAVVDLGVAVRLLGPHRVLDVAQWRRRRFRRIGMADRDGHAMAAAMSMVKAAIAVSSRARSVALPAGNIISGF